MNPIDGISDGSINNNVNNNVQKWTIKKEQLKRKNQVQKSCGSQLKRKNQVHQKLEVRPLVDELKSLNDCADIRVLFEEKKTHLLKRFEQYIEDMGKRDEN